MDFVQGILRSFIKGPTDVVGLELSAAGVKAAHLRREKETIHLVAADIIEGVEVSPRDGRLPRAIPVPRSLRAPYAALAVAGPKAVVKLINLPGRFTDNDEQNLVANLGVQEDTHRIGYSIVSEGHGRGETRVLAVAMPDDDAAAAVAFLPAGRPAPCALTLAGLAALNGFVHGPGEALREQTVGVIDGGDNCTTFAIFHKGVPVLIRRFDFGEETVIAMIGEKLSVDAKTARGFMNDASFDVSAILHQSLESSFKQIVISKEFVERRENCRISEVLVSGNLSLTSGIDETVKHFLGTDVRHWNPFSGLVASPQALAESVAGREPLFAAAVGAAMGVLMESP